MGAYWCGTDFFEYDLDDDIEGWPIAEVEAECIERYTTISAEELANAVAATQRLLQKLEE